MRPVRAGQLLLLLHRALDAACDATIVGGVLAMPVGGLAAIVGPTLPVGGPLQHGGGLIYGIAVLWFVVALVAAHLRYPQERSASDGPRA